MKRVRPVFFRRRIRRKYESDVSLFQRLHVNQCVRVLTQLRIENATSRIIAETNHEGIARREAGVQSELYCAHMRHHARQMANSCLQIASISAPCRDLRLLFSLSISDEKG